MIHLVITSAHVNTIAVVLVALKTIYLPNPVLAHALLVHSMPEAVHKHVLHPSSTLYLSPTRYGILAYTHDGAPGLAIVPRRHEKGTSLLQ